MKNNKGKRDKKIIICLVKYIYQISPRFFILSCILAISAGFTSTLSVYALKLMINSITNVSISGTDEVAKALIVYGIINIFVLFIRSMNGYITDQHQRLVNYKMNLDVLNKCKTLSIKDFEDSEHYNIIARAEREGRGKIYVTYQNLLSIVRQVASILSLLALILSWQSHIFFLIFISPILSTVINTRIGYKNYKMRMTRMSDMRKTSYINYLLTNDIACKEVKTYNIGNYLINLFSRIMLKVQKQDLNITKEKTLWDVKLGLFEECIGLFVIYNIVKMSVIGQIMIGDTVAYIDSLSIVQSNVGGFLKSISEVYNNFLYVEQYFVLLHLQPEDNYKQKNEIDSIESIVFKNVSFTYKSNSEMTLSNINVTFSKGDMIAIVGENGSGKTTFIKLLSGFYDTYEGEIFINGIELKNISPRSLRKQMGIIFQDFNKYELTLRENIGFGDLNQLNNNSKIVQVLEKIHLNDKIKDYSEGIDTQMGHWFGGEQLSKGQWQRIALGRALIRDADIYILDEPTASLDPISEREVFKLMLDQSKGKICIFITHRLENIGDIDPRVIVFSNGEIVEDRKHKSLKNSSLVYTKLFGA